MRKRFYRMLSILGTDFITHWAYEERISALAQPAVKCEQLLHVQSMLSIREQILSHTEHTRNEFHRMLSIHGTDFIACWSCAEMLKSWISRPNQIQFSKISCYRPLGPYGFSFCKKRKKNSCLCTFKVAVNYKGGGGCEWHQSNHYDFPYNCRCYLGTLKGLISLMH